MPMVRAMRLLNAVEAGTTTGAQLETLLTDATNGAGRLAELNVLMGMRGQARRMAASSNAMAAVAASSTAMNAVAASSTAMNAVIASSTAMAAVNANDQAVRIWMLAGTNQIYSDFANVAAVAASSTAMNAVAASSTAMNAVAASSTARLAVHASDTALTAIAGSATAIAAIKAATTYVINSTASVGSSAVTTTLSGKYIMVGWSDSVSNTTTTITGQRAGSKVGTLAGASIAVGSTADTNNVMALESPVTVKVDTAVTTVYLGVLPV